MFLSDFPKVVDGLVCADLALVSGSAVVNERLGFGVVYERICFGVLGDVVVGFLGGGGCSRGGGNWGTLRIPREDWGTLGNIRGITTPP